MKILLLNTSDNTGGAAVACSRLMDALHANGVEVKMMVRDRSVDDRRIVGVCRRWWRRLLDSITPGGCFAKAMERLLLLPAVGFSWRRVWAIDANIMGTDITRSVEFRDADVVHLHWVNQGMLSMDDISKIMKSGKRVVWTMHDLWCATALCHYAGDCTEFTNPEGCRRCPLTGGKSSLAKRTWKEKKKTYARSRAAGKPLTFVTCSEWLGRQVRKSSLLCDYEVVSIPNPIDTSVFQPKEKTAIRKSLGLPTDGKVILFVSQKVTDERKGAPYFIESMKVLAASAPDLKDKLTVAVLGGHSDDVVAAISSEENGGWKGYSFGYVMDRQKIVDIYNSADCYVLPSLADNLPNTIMEAMACGVPCVGFDIGGIPEMIDHESNGYIAVPGDSADLAHGIFYCLDDGNKQRLSDACVEKVQRTYSERAVAEKFMTLYERNN